MTVLGSHILAGASGQGGYNLTNSLRFRSSVSAYLNRTPASTSSRTTWTWSGWVKLGRDPDGFFALFGADANGYPCSGIALTNYNIQYFSYTHPVYDWQKISTMVLRDHSAWYHIVAVTDTTNGTAEDRARVYVNGQRVTSWSTNNNPSPSFAGYVNSSSYVTKVGRVAGFGYFDGYMSEVNFIDGLALDPSSFGETSTSTGVWIPKKYVGSYGTNGFYLDFEDNSSTAALGYDAAGSNDFTVNNISLTTGATYDSMKDVPTLTSVTQANYAVINPLQNGGLTITNGNLTWAGAGSSAKCATGSIAMPSGKWYFEALITGSSGGNWYAGVCNLSPTLTSAPSATATGWGLVTGGGGSVLYKVNNNTFTSLSSSSVTGSVVSFAIDVDAGKIWFAQNGNWLEGSPSAGTGASYTNLTGTQIPFVAGYDSNDQGSINFGQRPFAYTPPTGFKALNTFNLTTPTIGAMANKYMDVNLYSGTTGSNLTVTNSGSMQPDLVWLKARNQAGYGHQLYDSVRGVQKRLRTNTTDPEATNTGGLLSFNSNGFTIGTDGFINETGTTMVGWQWKENASAGFDILTYTGNGGSASSSQYVNHSLGVTPNVIITKVISSGASNPSWYMYHSAVQSGNFAYYGILNSTAAWSTGSSPYQLWTANATQIAFNEAANESGKNYVAYLFAQVDGYSKFGSYTGTGAGDSNGPFIYCGFRPAFILIKVDAAGYNWAMMDSKRPGYNSISYRIMADVANEEITVGDPQLDFLSNGFKLRAGNANYAGTVYYMAFAESPFKYANAR